MATRKGSDNRFPFVRIMESSLESDPTPTGEVHFYVNESTKLPYVVDDAGTVTPLTGAALHDHTGALDGGDLDGALVDGYIVFTEESAPGSADSGTVRVYAKSDGKMYAKDDAGTEHDLTAGGGVPPGTLLGVHKNTASGNVATSSSTLADIDATNAAITITIPASGNVLFRVTCSFNIPGANQNAFMGLAIGSTNLVNGTTGTFLWQGQTATSQEPLATWCAYVTGLTPGSATVKVRHAVNGGTTLTMRGATNSPMTIEAWAG